MVDGPILEPGSDGEGHVLQISASAKINGLLQALGEARAGLGKNATDHVQKVISAVKNTRNRMNASSSVPQEDVLSPLLASIQHLADEVENAIQGDTTTSQQFDALLSQVEKVLANLGVAYHFES